VRLLADGDGEAAELLIRSHLRRAHDVLAAGLGAAEARNVSKEG
jgi:hypothetical protein